MNRLPTLFIGIFLTFAFAWIGLIVLPYTQIGRLQPTVNEDTGDIYPPTPANLAYEGEKVYAAQGCFYCHSQQIRSREEGSDMDRGWGSRQTVARDYIRQNRVFLGSQRNGPDLSNVGARLQSEQWHYQHLYDPRSINSESIMPSFSYLFEVRPIIGKKSNEALELTGADAPPAGYEVVPTREAKALVAYLLSLNKSYSLKEASE